MEHMQDIFIKVRELYSFQFYLNAVKTKYEKID